MVARSKKGINSLGGMAGSGGTAEFLGWMVNEKGIEPKSNEIKYRGNEFDCRDCMFKERCWVRMR